MSTMSFDYYSLDFDIGDEPVRVNFYLATQEIKWGADADGRRGEVRHKICDVIIEEAFLGHELRRWDPLTKNEKLNLKDIILNHVGVLA